jgi:hypothetical protein
MQWRVVAKRFLSTDDASLAASEGGVMEIHVFEWWEKILGFLQFDCAAIEILGEDGANIHFMTMYGEVYFQAKRPTAEDARAFLQECGFTRFDPTPERLQFRGPHQVTRFVMAQKEQPERIYAHE